MKRTFFTAILIVVGLVTINSTLAFSKETNTKNQSGTEQEIMKLMKELADAHLRGDTETMNRIEADDYVLINENTAIPTPKESQLAGIKTRTEAVRKQMTATTRSYDQVKMRTYGNVVIVNGIHTATSPDSTGATRSSKALYTGVWVKRNGRWQVVNAQYTPLPEQKPQSGN